MDMLIHRYVYMEQIFGTEQEFREIINKIICILLS